MGTLTLHIIFITCNENIHTRFHLISKDSTRKCNQLNGPKQSSATPKKQWKTCANGGPKWRQI